MGTLTEATRANLDKVNYQDIVVKKFNEGRLVKYLTIRPNMLNGDPITKMGMIDNITYSSAGCVTGNAKNAKDALEEETKLVEFKTMKIKLALCPDDFCSKLIGAGIKPDDDTDGSKTGEAVKQLTTNSMKLDLLRFGWLGDTTILSTALNAGVPVEKYNLKNGFYKQILDGVAASKIEKVTLNASDLLGNVMEAESLIHYDAKSDAVLYATTDLYTAIKKLTMTSENITAQMRMIEGVEVLYFNGYEVVELQEVSRYLKKDFKVVPSFMVLTNPENLVAAIDRSEIAATSFKEDADSGMFYLRAAYQADFKIAHNASVVFIGA